MSDNLGGVYISEDGGQTRQAPNNDLLNQSISRQFISADGLHRHVGSYAGGVLRLDMNGQQPEAAFRSQATQPTQKPTAIVNPDQQANPSFCEEQSISLFSEFLIILILAITQGKRKKWAI